MPKATITFDLPEEEREYTIANQAQDVLAFISEFNMQLRAYQKYGHNFTDADDALSKIRQNFFDLLNQYKTINIDL
jgi:hypothetical protein